MVILGSADRSFYSVQMWLNGLHVRWMLPSTHLQNQLVIHKNQIYLIQGLYSKLLVVYSLHLHRQASKHQFNPIHSWLQLPCVVRLLSLILSSVFTATGRPVCLPKILVS